MAESLLKMAALDHPRQDKPETMSLYHAYCKPEAPRPEEKPVDWFTILAHLGAQGYKLRHVAEALSVALATVQGWKNGSIPNYEAGHALLKLHTKHCINVRNTSKNATQARV